MWIMLHVIGLIRMEVLRRRYRRAEEEEAWISPLATALQHAQLIYLLGAMFVGIAFQPFVFMLIAAQIGLDTYLRRRSAPAPARLCVPAASGAGFRPAPLTSPSFSRP